MAQDNGDASKDILARSDVLEEPGMSVTEAGRKGGKTTAARRGPEFYREIGRKGGVATSEAHGPAFYSAIGRKGGEARAEDPDVRSGALGRKGALARWGAGEGEKGEDSDAGAILAAAPEVSTIGYAANIGKSARIRH